MVVIFYELMKYVITFSFNFTLYSERMVALSFYVGYSLHVFPLFQVRNLRYSVQYIMIITIIKVTF